MSDEKIRKHTAAHNDAAKQAADPSEQKPTGANGKQPKKFTPLKPQALIFEGMDQGAICDPLTGVCEIPKRDGQ